MSDYVISSPRTTELLIGAGDTVLVQETGSIAASSGVIGAIDSQGSSGAVITVRGSITNSGSAIVAASSSIANSSSVTSASSTAVLQLGGRNYLHNRGSINGDVGVEIGEYNTSGNRVVNDGTINGTTHGMKMYGDGSIINNGVISGGRAGITLNGVSSTVVNYGKIAGGINAAVEVYGIDSDAIIINSGVLINGVNCFNGSDFYDGRHGSITGRIALGGGNDTALGGLGFETFRGDGGNDLIDGGGGNDVALYQGLKSEYTITTSGGVTTLSDTIATRDGTDTLTNVRFLEFSDGERVVLSNAAPDGLSLSATSLAETAPVNTPVIKLSGHDADGDALTYSLVDPSGTFKVQGDSLVLVKGLDFESGAHQIAVTLEARDAYGGRTSQAFTIEVTNVIEENALVLDGTAGADVLSGENGNDRLLGHGGKDVLAGGGGQDVFVFDTRLSTRTYKKHLDTITDFNPTDDTIQLARSAFKSLKKGMLKASAFYKGASAHDASDRIVYDRKKGILYYDDDGNGAHKAVAIAKLAKNLKIDHHDFFVI